MDLGLGLALGAGVLSFASPCLLPIVPGYLTFITGMSFAELAEEHRPARVAALAAARSVPFVVGFSLVFVALGASASALGGLLREHLPVLRVVAGLGIVALGIHMTGLLPIPALLREHRLSQRAAAPGLGRAFVAGLLFAFGWTPCVGPVLAGILAVAAGADTVGRGVLLLAAYSAGIAVPLVLSAAFLNGFLVAFRGLRRHLRHVEAVCGVLLILGGGLVLSGRVGWIASQLSFLDPERLLVEETAVPAPPTPDPDGTYGAYGFTLPALDGTPLRLEQFAGRPVLVNFWATWCEPCEQETPTLVEAFRTYAERGLQLVGVAVMSETPEVRAFAARHGIPYPVALDEWGDVSAAYQVFGMPSSYLFGPRGELLHTFAGYVSAADLAEVLEQHLPR